jgi:catechol-2,3-dioxygenase
MAVVGIEEIFLKVKDMVKAIEFYNGILGIPLDKQDGERTYLQLDRGHLVLQIENHTGRHQGGGPLHFAMTVTEEEFDEILAKFDGGRYFTRGPYGEKGKGRALFMIDPDGNEAEINTRYLYGVPQRV